MSLDVYLEEYRPCRIYSDNITHNLGNMARAAGIYECLWRPDEIGIETAKQLIEPLNVGLVKLLANPDKFKKYNSPNGWGTYDNFIVFVQDYISACEKNPNALVRVSR